MALVWGRIVLCASREKTQKSEKRQTKAKEKTKAKAKEREEDRLTDVNRIGKARERGGKTHTYTYCHHACHRFVRINSFVPSPIPLSETRSHFLSHFKSADSTPYHSSYTHHHLLHVMDMDISNDPSYAPQSMDGDDEVIKTDAWHVITSYFQEKGLVRQQLDR